MGRIPPRSKKVADWASDIGSVPKTECGPLAVVPLITFASVQALLNFRRNVVSASFRSNDPDNV